MTISIDTSVLTAWYQAKAGVNASNGSGSSASTTPKDPTPPWSNKASVPRSAALAKSVMAGARFVDPTAAKLDAPAKTQTADYKNLFALYQGLNALEGLTELAQSKTAGPTELASIRARFAAGMQEIAGYLNSKPFADFELAQGAVSATATTKAGVKTETDTYQTRSIFAGTPGDEVPAFAGDARFSVTATKVGGAQVPVDVDLAEMGSTPRTMSNVVAYLNDKLKTAGLATRFSTVRTPATPQVIKTGSTTMTLPAGPDQFSLKIVGVSTETLNLSAPTTTPAVYIAQANGATSPAQELVKLGTDPADPSTMPISKTALGGATAAARATATAPDGSLYVLTDVTGPAPDGQAIKGQRDVVLSKYDSAGNLTYSRTLGAAASASGYALTVSADGSKVAVAGSVTGALDNGTTGDDKAATDSFVSVFNAAGEEQWTRRQGAKADDQATGVAFGADGSVFVTGTTQSALPGGAVAAGGADGYLQGFSATGASTFTTQFGSSSNDKTSGVAVAGSSVIVAGVEAGHAVVRRYDLASDGGAPALGAVRDLGALEGGDVAGVAIAADGSVLVAGSTHKGALDAGATTQAYDGGRDGFVARLASDLQPSGSDALTYVGGGQDRTVTGLATSGGQVYLTGQVATTPLPGQTTAFDGYALALDPGTGAVGWSRSLRGGDATDAPSAISVASAGASVLDKLGLPSGTIDYGHSQTLVGTTAIRAGDQFYVGSGSSTPKAVTIEAGDTLETLATKIARASGFTATVTPTVANGVRTLKITPANGNAEVTLKAGPPGRDALGSLGLAEGRIETATTAKPKVGQPTADGKTYGLGLSSTLDLTDAASIKAAQSAVINAAQQLRLIYIDMKTDVASKTAAATGSVPAYLSAQLANYQAGLARLTS